MSVLRGTSPYSTEFYLSQREGSLRSAKSVLPTIFDLVHPKSVVDVGCGVGTWLSVAQQLGVEDIVGLDGDYVDRMLLVIPTEKFITCDLAGPLPVQRSFELALCLEVVEHLPPSAAAQIIAELARLAPVVLFSAAIPGQGGTHHVNEQWPEYWQELFARHGYLFCDCIRPRAWNDSDIEICYRQNAFLVAHKSWLRLRPELQPAMEPLARVHPALWNMSTRAVEGLRSGRDVSMRPFLRMFPSVFARMLRARLYGSKREVIGGQRPKTTGGASFRA